MAPVFTGIATPELELERIPLLAAVAEEAGAGVGPVPIDDVGAGTPDVRGFSDALEAPANATDCTDADACGIALVMFGLRTLSEVSTSRHSIGARGVETYLSMTCTTPLETRTLGMMTLALLTNTLPSSIRMVRLPPFIVFKLVPFIKLEL